MAIGRVCALLDIRPASISYHQLAGRVPHTMKFRSTAKVLAKCMLKCYRISECHRATLVAASLENSFLHMSDIRVCFHTSDFAAAFAMSGAQHRYSSPRTPCMYDCDFSPGPPPPPSSGPN